MDSVTEDWAQKTNSVGLKRLIAGELLCATKVKDHIYKN